ncbi:DUF397 domain-containing protein [Amycolatopsis jiangsuensis]|uniref:DUF397 domain-containing protein n=1 Tax=Amycolatopsis jiangsuensis TaxID=1181879 RepID=A0A840IVG4_9PSEU|nr:DUF397 domain-containing protein [Amycolatopsis jiangsuensis]MBB4685509.1 hypothetical protein [Amycolatopsis jiangsuensis]
MSERPTADRAAGQPDDKAHIRHELDLTGVAWTRAEPEGETLEHCVEYALVPHTDGLTYVALRQPAEPDGAVLIFTPTEWDAFTNGVRAGEFELPEDLAAG